MEITKEEFDALERIINQVGGGYSEEFYKDFSIVKEFIELNK